jgi:soluble lytic murein transglycosylase
MSGHDGAVAGCDAAVARVLAFFALALATACGRSGDSRAPVPITPPAAASPVVIASAAPAADGAASDAWPVLVRDEQWDAAWRALTALPDAEKGRPEIRYVSARVALARNDEASALGMLEGLESALPLLASDIERRRAEAKAAVGPYTEAGEWFAARTTPSAQLDAARAFEKGGDFRRARVAADRVVAAEKHTRAQEAEARALRVRLLAKTPAGDSSDAGADTARGDARWLAIQGADLSAAADAIATLARVDPNKPLTGQEWLARADTLSTAGRLDAALRAIDSAATAPPPDRAPPAARAHARAMALYHARGRYLEAARALTEAAALGGKNAAQDSFYAARALSRADRDDEAIAGYERVERRFAKTPWAEQSAFLVPYLQMLHGQWRECGRGFREYGAAYPAGESVREARNDGALCTLLDGDAKTARVLLEHLVEDEPDPLASARLANLAALAALRDGDRAHAVMRWTDVVKSRPLSWPALVAEARLAEIGAEVPPLIEVAPAVTTPAAPDPPPLTVAIPPPADMLHELGLEQDAESALRERESVVAGSAGPRASEALCTVYGRLSRARRRYQISQTLPSALFAVAPTGGTRWAWDCAFPTPYEDAVRDAETREQIPHGLLWAVMRQESAFDPDALSPARAVGLMQLMPETARPLAEELSLPRDDARLTSPPYAIRIGARELHKLLDAFHGNVPLAIAAYNGGAESVERWASRAPGMQVDTFVERIPFKETRDYVVRVMGNLARYQYLARSDGPATRLPLAL